MDVFKSICDGECPFFDIKEACKVSRVRIFLSTDLLGSQHLLEVLQRKIAIESANFFFEKKEGYKVSCAKILTFRKIKRRLVFI